MIAFATKSIARFQAGPQFSYHAAKRPTGSRAKECLQGLLGSIPKSD